MNRISRVALAAIAGMAFVAANGGMLRFAGMQRKLS
jgi:hypothetical protein